MQSLTDYPTIVGLKPDPVSKNPVDPVDFLAVTEGNWMYRVNVSGFRPKYPLP
jgi:hypothetical protein